MNKTSISSNGTWDWAMKEYDNNNPISQTLLRNFYHAIGTAIKSAEMVERVLELGCGPGESTKRLTSMLGPIHLEASDVDQMYVDKLNALYVPRIFPYKFTTESVTDIKRTDNSFDLLIALEVLEHVEDFKESVKELFRVTSRYVLISVPNEPLWRLLNIVRGKYIATLGNTPGHVNHFSYNSLRELIAPHGIIKKAMFPLPWIVILSEKR